jgi:RND family efflux transporter MFP subunit
MPGQVFSGTIVHLAGALDPVSRTLQAEVHIPNKEHKLMPGTYAQVKLTATRTQPPIIIPSTALDVHSDGEYVAVVGAGNKIHYTKVEIGRDNGPDVELTTGLKGGETVVLEPTDELREGSKVSPQLKKEDKSKR